MYAKGEVYRGETPRPHVKDGPPRAPDVSLERLPPDVAALLQRAASGPASTFFSPRQVARRARERLAAEGQ